MKKLSFLFIALALVVFVACQSEEKKKEGAPGGPDDSGIVEANPETGEAVASDTATMDDATATMEDAEPETDAAE